MFRTDSLTMEMLPLCKEETDIASLAELIIKYHVSCYLNDPVSVGKNVLKYQTFRSEDYLT